MASNNIPFTEGDFMNFNYIVRHKRNFLKAFNMCISCIHLFREANIDYTVDFSELKNRILQHDLDKFKPDIFYAYTDKFYNEVDLNVGKLDSKSSPLPDNVLAALSFDSKQDIEDEFEKAWTIHYTSNRHHPEYYKKHGGKMQDIDIFEMCIDFTAMSIKYGGKPYDYYKKKKSELVREFKNIINHDLLSKLLEIVSNSYKFRKIDEIDEQEN